MSGPGRRERADSSSDGPPPKRPALGTNSIKRWSEEMLLKIRDREMRENEGLRDENAPSTSHDAIQSDPLLPEPGPLQSDMNVAEGRRMSCPVLESQPRRESNPPPSQKYVV
ncbi:hypothetical protein Q1695_007012 [Nippostrongylus brasiliensis]|nr:hypothetical protein Q1695_007012 [Nippostrongylus brasiliensis]